MNSSLRPPDARSGILIALATALAASVPISIQGIADPTLRTIVTVSVLLLVIAFAWKAKPPVETERMPQASIPDTAVETEPETPNAKRGRS